VSYNSTPPFKLKLLRDRAVVVLGRVYISPIELAGSYIGLIKPLYFIRYIYLYFRLLYLILLTLLIKYLFILSTLTSRGGS